ncbi:MAG: GEVED domain-containing protein [Candidatus Promineifilaceae bacterium]
MRRSPLQLNSVLPLLLAILLMAAAFFYVNRATSSSVNSDSDLLADIEDRDDDGDGIPTAVEDANRDGNPTNDDRDGDDIADYLDNSDCSINDIDFEQQWLYDFSSFVGAGDQALDLMLRTPIQDRIVTVSTDAAAGFAAATSSDPQHHGEPKIDFYQIDQTITLQFAPLLEDDVRFELMDGTMFTATLNSPLVSQSSLDGTIQTVTATVVNNAIVLVIDVPNDDPNQVSSLRIPNVTRDSDGDLIPDHIDLDDDHDGLLDTVEDANVSNVCDTDEDGLPDSRDLDSDGDGLTDNIEAQSAENYIPPANKDGNQNGVDDAYESARAPLLAPINSDLTDSPDYVDTDSNNDGQPDNIEAGLGTGGSVDTDGDGIVDDYDAIELATMGSSVASIQNNVSNPSALPAWQAVTLDCGDLPDNFTTTIAQNGPCHTLGSLYLGSIVDSEVDGVPSSQATGDDDDDATNDDDGLVWAGFGNGFAVFEVTVSGGDGELGIWVDWNNDSSFGSDEFAGVAVVEGVNTVQVPYTEGAILSSVRVRLFPTGGAPGGVLDSADFSGTVGNGEVEDYFLASPTASEVSLNQLDVDRSGLQIATLMLITFFVLVAATLILQRNRRLAGSSPFGGG